MNPARLCRDHPVAAFLITTFALSWPVMIATRGIDLPIPLIGVPPSLAAFLVVGIGEGRPGLRRLAGRLLIARVGLRWYAFALLAMGLTFWTASYLLTATDLRSGESGRRFRPRRAR